MSSQQVTPRWGNFKQARIHSGLSIRLLQDYVKDGLIRSSVVTKPGAKRGVRLIDLKSLDAFIEAGIGGKIELAMNLNRSTPVHGPSMNNHSEVTRPAVFEMRQDRSERIQAIKGFGHELVAAGEISRILGENVHAQIASISFQRPIPDYPCVVCQCWDVTDPGSLLCPDCLEFNPKSCFTLP